ncbi:hypothetical protein MRX96_024464 [Rhipicephalus microplus]
MSAACVRRGWRLPPVTTAASSGGQESWDDSSSNPPPTPAARCPAGGLIYGRQTRSSTGGMDFSCSRFAVCFL